MRRPHAGRLSGRADAVSSPTGMARVISFLSDFGLSDTYVGQVKGAMLTVCPEAQIVDVTHGVPPQDIQAGAFALWAAVEAFPGGTVHLAVVDPGVGTGRRAVAARCGRGDCLVGPDNGLLAAAAERLGGAVEIVLLEAAELRRAEVSSTFHGRDIFGPAAAYLARGTALSSLGPRADALTPGPPIEQASVEHDGTIVGTIVHVDTFGNLVTSIARERLPTRFHVGVAGQTIHGAPHQSYQSVAPGSLLALVGSCGLLEISVRDGSADRATGARRGDPVRIEPEQP